MNFDPYVMVDDHWYVTGIEELEGEPLGPFASRSDAMIGFDEFRAKMLSKLNPPFDPRIQTLLPGAAPEVIAAAEAAKKTK